MARIVLNTFGSLGDLHPYLAVAIGLRNRGHQPCIATAEIYRLKIENEGIVFAPVRPELSEIAGKQEIIDKLWHPKKGAEFLIRDYILPQLEQSYQELLAACQGADLLLTHLVGYAGPVVADTLKLPWLSVALQPMAFMSRYDMPVLAPALYLKHLRHLGPVFSSLVLATGAKVTNSWAEPIVRLRKRLGLKAPMGNPVLGEFSPFGTLALFSHVFAQPQRDWPPNVTVTGFAFYDHLGDVLGVSENGSDELRTFLGHGSAPLVFTLGSSAVQSAQNFYLESFKATERLGMRAVLLVGPNGRSQFPERIPDSIHIASYAPYSELMPKAAAIVHQGGIGTTAQAIRAGRPMLIVPWGFDQPDNADRIQKLGVGRMLPRKKYSAGAVAKQLTQLLSSANYAERATALGRKVAAEDGVIAACDAVEAALTRS